jgi:hypothetical protein
MARIVDILSIALMIAAGIAFTVGVAALGEARDLAALYWLAVGGLLLRAATDILRPRSGDR